MTVDDELLKQFADEFAALDALQPVAFEFTRPQCFFLLAMLQLALRHPGNRGPASEFTRRLATQLENAVSVSPALREMARRGWGDAG